MLCIFILHIFSQVLLFLMLFVKCVNYLIKKECDASGSFMLNPQNKRKDENDKIYD